MQFGILRANRTEDLLVASNEIVSSFYYYFSYRFCTAVFSKKVRSISMKFSGLIVNHTNLIRFFCFDDFTSGFEKSPFFVFLEGFGVRIFSQKV